MANFKGIVYLSEEQYLTLKTNGTITVQGITINYDEDTLYITDDDTSAQLLALNSQVATIESSLANKTNVKFNNVHQDTVEFSSDPQTQLNNLETNKADRSSLNTTNQNVSNLDTNKANKDLSNVTYPQVIANGIAQTGAGDRVVESKIYSDGKTWYRIWASGWKECGGKLTKTSGTTLNTQVTFSITFTQIPIVIAQRNEHSAYTSGSVGQSQDDVVARAAALNRVSTTGFYFNLTSYSTEYMYYACGY